MFRLGIGTGCIFMIQFLQCCLTVFDLLQKGIVCDCMILASFECYTRCLDIILEIADGSGYFDVILIMFDLVDCREGGEYVGYGFERGIFRLCT